MNDIVNITSKTPLFGLIPGCSGRALTLATNARSERIYTMDILKWGIGKRRKIYGGLKWIDLPFRRVVPNWPPWCIPPHRVVDQPGRLNTEGFGDIFFFLKLP
jgi:hypothetical protein